ncbi:MAG: MotA/TolQ/ExbB proton channel family protein [Candidatus Latescibacteria bacterium]|nr:MotA/TolQ/ExbB proton channel family protein [Candidatus Latescibacterota bacterium]
MIHEFQVGGSIMWFLLACALLGLILLIERIFTIFLKMRLNTKTFVANLIQTIEKGGVKAGMEACDNTTSPVAKVLKSALEKSSGGRALMEDAVLRASSTELTFLDRGMSLLGGIITVAPFFGFLGTVTGMIRAFAAVAAVGEVEPTVVASGISEALVTTKWGLMIAAPLSIVFILIQSKINSYTREMESSASTLIDYLAEKFVCTPKQAANNLCDKQ